MRRKSGMFKVISFVVSVLFTVNNISFGIPDIAQSVLSKSTLRVMATAQQDSVRAGLVESLTRDLVTPGRWSNLTDLKSSFAGEISSLGVPAVGRLVDPGRLIEQGVIGPQADKYRATPKPTIPLGQILTFLKDAGGISAEASLRGADLGSSMDLGRGAGMREGLKELVTPRGAKELADFAQTIVIPSKFKAKIRITALTEEEQARYGRESIVYISDLHGCPAAKPNVYTKPTELVDGKAPRKQADMVGYILWNLFGVHSVKVEFDVYYPGHEGDKSYGIIATKAGGMGTSGATNTLLYELGQMLSNGGLTRSECAAEAIDDENTVASGYTGGQEGYVATAAEIEDNARAVDLVWISGVKNAKGETLYQPHAAFSVPMLNTAEDVKFVEEHAVYLQMGANFVLDTTTGKIEKTSHRSASSINTGWMHSAMTTKDANGNDVPVDIIGAGYHRDKVGFVKDMRDGLLARDIILINRGNMGHVNARNNLSLREAQMIVEGDASLNMPPQVNRLNDYSISDKIGLATYGLPDDQRKLVEADTMALLEQEKSKQPIADEDMARLDNYVIANLKILLANKISLYSDYSKALYDAMAQEMAEDSELSMSAFNTGAGGDGGIIMLWSSKGVKHIEDFLLRRLGIKRFDPAEVIKVTTQTGGVLRGWMPFEVGEIGTRVTLGNMSLKQAEERGFIEPEAAPMMDYDETTTAYTKTASAGNIGILLDPGNLISQGITGRAAVDYRAAYNTTRTARQARNILRQTGGLVVEGPLRGLDFGSSQDLQGLKELLTPADAKRLDEMAATTIFASKFRGRIKIEALGEEQANQIVYVARIHGLTESRPRIFTEQVKLVPNEKGQMVTPGGQADAIAYILWNLFGIRGVKVTYELYYPGDERQGIERVPQAGGMGTSGNTNVELLLAGSVLSGVGLSVADAVAEATIIENTVFEGYTGGQEAFSTVLGGAYKAIWPGGIMDASRQLKNHHFSAFAVPVFQEEEDFRWMEERTVLVQPGVRFGDVNGKIKKLAHRSASSINTQWMKLAQVKPNGEPLDPIGASYHRNKIQHGNDQANGAATRNMELLNRGNIGYVQERDKLCLRWMELVLYGDEKIGLKGPQEEWLSELSIPDRIGLATYVPKSIGEGLLTFQQAQKIEHKLNPILGKAKAKTITAQDYETLNQFVITNLKVLFKNNISIYSDYAKDVFDAVDRVNRRAGKLVMSAIALGAGGDGGIVAIFCSEGKDVLTRLLADLGLNQFEPSEVERIVTREGGTLEGWWPYEISRKGLEMNFVSSEEFAKGQGFIIPLMPESSQYDETTGTYAPVKAASAGENRVVKLNEALQSMETQLTILAGTAVKDKDIARRDWQEVMRSAEQLAGTSKRLRTKLVIAGQRLRGEAGMAVDKAIRTAENMTTAVAAAGLALRMQSELAPAQKAGEPTTEKIQRPLLNVYVESTGLIQQQFNMAKDTKTATADGLVSHLDAIKNKYSCDMQAKTLDEIKVLSPENAIAVALTPQGKAAFEAKGFGRVIMLSEIQDGYYFDFEYLATLTRGWDALASVSDTAAKRRIWQIMSLAYTQLTGQNIPDGLLESPAKFILNILLPEPVGPAYTQDQLRDIHRQRLLTLVAA